MAGESVEECLVRHHGVEDGVDSVVGEAGDPHRTAPGPTWTERSASLNCSSVTPPPTRPPGTLDSVTAPSESSDRSAWTRMAMAMATADGENNKGSSCEAGAHDGVSRLADGGHWSSLLAGATDCAGSTVDIACDTEIGVLPDVAARRRNAEVAGAAEAGPAATAAGLSARLAPAGVTLARVRRVGISFLSECPNVSCCRAGLARHQSRWRRPLRCDSRHVEAPLTNGRRTT